MSTKGGIFANNNKEPDNNPIEMNTNKEAPNQLNKTLLTLGCTAGFAALIGLLFWQCFLKGECATQEAPGAYHTGPFNP